MTPVEISILASQAGVAISNALGIAKKAGGVSNALAAGSSLIDFTKPSRVEPITIVSKDCLTLDYLPDVLQSTLSVFSAYYLQAVSMLAAKVDDVKVGKLLDRINPDQSTFVMESISDSYHQPQYLDQKNYKYRLPTSKNTRAMGAEITISKEGFANSADSENVKNVMDTNSLAVGKILNVKLTTDSVGKNGENRTITMPVTVRLATVAMPNSSVENLLANKGENEKFGERYHAWRAGRISLIKDLILAQDLIDSKKKALMEDEQGVYSEIIRRVNNSRKRYLMSGDVPMAVSSNIFIITEEVAKGIEQKLGGKLSSARIRQQAFENTYAMIIVVIDRDWERVTFYYRGITMPTEVSVRDLKSANKNKGIDIMDVLKAYSFGNAPTF